MRAIFYLKQHSFLLTSFESQIYKKKRLVKLTFSIENACRGIDVYRMKHKILYLVLAVRFLKFQKILLNNNYSFNHDTMLEQFATDHFTNRFIFGPGRRAVIKFRMRRDRSERNRDYPLELLLDQVVQRFNVVARRQTQLV